MEKDKKLQLKTTIQELTAKYNALYTQSKTLCPETSDIYLEMLKDIKELDAICKERNRY